MAAPTADTVALWYHYEEIAMHFNGLIIQFRLQLIGGVGALGTAALYLIGGKDMSVAQRRLVRTVASCGLLVLLMAAAMLDIFYYDQLLRGAVTALVDFERNNPDIQMSTKILETVGWGVNTPRVAYALILLVLGSFTAWSWRDYASHRPAN
jgi:hypothetical protein